MAAVAPSIDITRPFIAFVHRGAVAANPAELRDSLEYDVMCDLVYGMEEGITFSFTLPAEGGGGPTENGIPLGDPISDVERGRGHSPLTPVHRFPLSPGAVVSADSLQGLVERIQAASHCYGQFQAKLEACMDCIMRDEAMLAEDFCRMAL